MNKFKNIRAGAYASKREAKRAAELKLLARAGKVRFLKEQVKYVLIPKQDGEMECSYIADFVFYEETEPGVFKQVTEDTKGVRTPLYVVKRKLMLFVHGIRVREV
jgi:hypothetical protein